MNIKTMFRPLQVLNVNLTRVVIYVCPVTLVLYVYAQMVKSIKKYVKVRLVAIYVD